MQNYHIEITIAILHSVICVKTMKFGSHEIYNLKYRIKRLFVINKIQIQVYVWIFYILVFKCVDVRCEDWWNRKMWLLKRH